MEIKVRAVEGNITNQKLRGRATSKKQKKPTSRG